MCTNPRVRRHHINGKGWATLCIYIFKHFLKIILTDYVSYWLRKYTPQ